MGTLLAPQVVGGCCAAADVLVSDVTCNRRGATVIAFVDSSSDVDANRDAAFGRGKVLQRNLDSVL
jgi:hypothetical protein